MELHYTLLMEIYSMLLMSSKKKLIKSYNINYLNEILKKDISDRYNSWISNNSPTIIDQIEMYDDDHKTKEDINIFYIKLIMMINTYEELCAPERINNGKTALIVMCGFYKRKLHKLANYMINVYGKSCIPEYICTDGQTALLNAIENSSISVAINLINTYGILCNPHALNYFGETALISACLHESEEIASHLINVFGKLCMYDQKDFGDKTALDHAKYFELNNITKLLERGIEACNLANHSSD